MQKVALVNGTTNTLKKLD